METRYPGIKKMQKLKRGKYFFHKIFIAWKSLVHSSIDRI